MLRLLFLVFWCFVIFSACGGREDNREPRKTEALPEELPLAPSIIIVGGCYSLTANRDTANMELNVLDNLVSGKLEYRSFEKDHNKGVIKGLLKDSIIDADYIFKSEGMTSVRQVVFKVKGDTLFEGFGEVEVRGDTVRFKDQNALQFLPAHSFVRSDCK